MDKAVGTQGECAVALLGTPFRAQPRAGARFELRRQCRWVETLTERGVGTPGTFCALVVSGRGLSRLRPPPSTSWCSSRGALDAVPQSRRRGVPRLPSHALSSLRCFQTRSQTNSARNSGEEPHTGEEPKAGEEQGRSRDRGRAQS